MLSAKGSRPDCVDFASWGLNLLGPGLFGAFGHRDRSTQRRHLGSIT